MFGSLQRPEARESDFSRGWSAHHALRPIAVHQLDAHLLGRFRATRNRSALAGALAQQLEEAAKLGDLYVSVGSDACVTMLKQVMSPYACCRIKPVLQL